MTRELTDLCKRVNKGAKFLDKVHPGWHKEINLDQLRLGNSKQCLLGSLYNDFYWGLDALKLNG